MAARLARGRVIAGVLAIGLVVGLGAQGNVDPKLAQLITFVRDDLNKYWAGQIRGYTPPAAVVMFTAPTTTDCGEFKFPNAFYCSSTHKIYWDTTFFTNQYKIGDFAPVFVLAHEWGHLVQRQLGFTRTDRGLLTVQLELQADCLAGTYAADASRRSLLDPGDDDEAVMSLRRAGDKLNAPWFDPKAHGSPGIRIDAFLYGFQKNDCTADPFFEFLKERGIDPGRIQQTPMPESGKLAESIRRQAGRFTLTATRRATVPGATDAIEADYKTPDGVQVAHMVVAMASPAAAVQLLNNAASNVRSKGWVEVKRQDVMGTDGTKIGTLVILHGSTEIIYWTNKHFLGMSEGPRDVAWEFYNALPY